MENEKWRMKNAKCQNSTTVPSLCILHSPFFIFHFPVRKRNESQRSAAMIDIAITLLTTLVGVGVTVLLAGIPWAYSVHGRLATIETSLRDTLNALPRLNELELRITRLEFVRQNASEE